MRVVAGTSAIAYEAMQDLIELFRHNTWANATVFDLAASLDSQLVTQVAPGHGIRSSVHSLIWPPWNTRISVLEGHPPQWRQEVQAWAAHDLSWFPEQMRHLGDRLVRLLESSTSQTLAGPLNVP